MPRFHRLFPEAKAIHQAETFDEGVAIPRDITKCSPEIDDKRRSNGFMVLTLG
jgi:hypothetical protein